MAQRTLSRAPLHEADLFTRRAARARLSLRTCTLCLRRCGADRLEGELGWCGIGPSASVAAAVLHKGEEPPFVGHDGAGCVFFAGCTLQCRFCQNYQISRSKDGGDPHSPSRLASLFLELQRRGAATLDLVSPTPHLADLLEALAISVKDGLVLPVVWNTNATESCEALALLNGVVDVYLPDFKYGTAEAAQALACPGYVEASLEAIDAMHRQVGWLHEDESGVAVSGVLVRHLVLPGDAAATEEALGLLVETFGPHVPLSLMAQYHPCDQCRDDPILGRTLRADEYDRAIEAAARAGFERVYFQELGAHRVGLPDFTAMDPFDFLKEEPEG